MICSPANGNISVKKLGVEESRGKKEMIRLNFFSIGPVLINGLPPIGEFPCHRQCTQWTRVFLSDSCNHSQSIYHRLLVKRTIFHLFFKNRNNFKFFRSFRKRWTLQKVAIKEFDRSFPVGKFTFHRFLMIKLVPGSTAFDLSLWTIFSDAGFSAEKNVSLKSMRPIGPADTTWPCHRSHRGDLMLCAGLAIGGTDPTWP